MSDIQTTDRIIVPSKYKCERHGWYSDVSPCRDCYNENSVKVTDLHGKANLPIACFIDDNRVLQVVVNTTDEYMLWATFHRIENAINFVLQQAEMKRQATAIQTAPASVLDKLR